MSMSADQPMPPPLVDGQPVVRPLSLRLHPDPILRQVCRPVEEFDSALADVLDEMLTLMRQHRGMGLAGPQAGILRRMFVAQIGDEPLCLVNPQIVAVRGRVTMREGCLSLPGMECMVERSRVIRVIAYDAHGRKLALRVDGIWSRVMQHEINHLDGVMICDCMIGER